MAISRNRKLSYIVKNAKSTVHGFLRLLSKPHSQVKSVVSTPKKSSVHKNIAIIVPTFKTSQTTVELIASLRTFNPTAQIVVVNDLIEKNTPEHALFTKIVKTYQHDDKVTILYSSEKNQKAGALNMAISHVTKGKVIPDVIYTCDDDIGINAQTLDLMTESLFADAELGAVCSRSLVKNKHASFLTRLQALEYFSFTVTKIADNNFLHGPLVMQGMLTGFKTEALMAVKGFTQQHLIEDYDITVRIKKAGWKVAIAKDAQAWTDVPETLKSLWFQRIRWGYWGIKVVKDHFTFIPAIFQDLLGHLVFANLLGLILISLVFYRTEAASNPLIQGIFVLSLMQFFLSYIFGIVTMFSYEDRDRTDWIMRITILPELLYSNIITLILLGCYVFLVYNVFLSQITKRISPLHKLHAKGLKGFARIGYAHTWGTRSTQ